MMNISRRNFLKGAAATGALVAMNGMSIAAAEEKAYTFADTIAWDAQYDVVVMGMGFAGMTAAMTAADEGANVLLAEKMSEALAGGNSKVAGQFFAYGHEDLEATRAYYQALTGGREVPEDTLEVIVNGVTHMWGNLKDLLFDGNDSEFMDWTGLPVIGEMSPEYPEFPGSDKIALCSTHMGASDSFLYTTTKNVMLRRPNIDVWYESPAVELIQEPETKTIVGVKISRGGKTLNVRALNGVVVCTGGFECDRDMAQQFLNLKNYSVIGGQYNTGDGIKMCMKAGAQLWHMGAYEGGFGDNSCGYLVDADKPATQIVTLARNAMNTGALVIVGTDGERFGNESEIPRHGHMYENGIWENPSYPNKIYMVFDQAQFDQMKTDGTIAEAFIPSVISAASIEELAEKTGCKAEALKDTLDSFNSFAANGKDYKFGRGADQMRAFEGDTYYAMPLSGLMLNTQGGPKRNPNGEVLDLDGNPIPHLYSAGEMGGITSCMYQGGTNIAECFIFGQISGKNAAAPKGEAAKYVAREQVASTPAMPGEITDIGAAKAVFEAGENQYIGTGKGMMGDITTRVTMADNKISAVEVLEQNETDGIGSRAIEQLPGQFVGCATAAEIDAIDTVSGATLTSNGLKEAVKAALAQAL